MKIYKFVAFAAFCVGSFNPAYAAEYFTTYSSTSGTATTASFWFTTADTLNATGGYDILSLRGDVNGDDITGLENNPKQPYLTPSANGKFSFNNVFYGTGPIVDNDGAVFNTVSGGNFNIYSNLAATLDYTLSGYIADPSKPGSWARLARSVGTLTPLTVPPAAPPRALPTGPTILTLEDARGYETGRISTTGFDFTSPVCCAYSYGIAGVSGDNGTQRIIYQNAPITMTVFDGSAFDVTSLDAGFINQYFESNLVMTLTGLRRDGSTVLANLDILPSFQPYMLVGFNDLISLTFGHPTGTATFLTFDNIAVSLSPAAVPEPTMWAMMIMGLGAVGSAMRSRRARRLVVSS